MSVLTKELALRIEKSEIDYMLSWAGFLQAIDGDPFGVEIRRYGDAVALANQNWSLGPLFNRVLGLSEDSLPHLPDILGVWTKHGLRCRIDVNPYQGTPKLCGALAQHGLNPFRFHSFLYATPGDVRFAADTAHNDSLAVRRIASAEAGIWAEVLQNGFIEVLGASPEIARQLSVATSQLCEHSGWGLYLAAINGEPVAVAALYAEDRMGSLGLAGTLPQIRKRGCQTALLQARLTDALAQDCDLIVAQSALGSTSQNNMERAGMKIAYTRAFWLSS